MRLSASASCVRLRAEVRGIVQGVGFRPFIYGLAQRFGLAGFVKNTAAGASFEVEGRPEIVDAFFKALPAQAPPLARITELVTQEVPPEGQVGFQIETSSSQTEKTALIAPDAAVCQDCLREMRDPADRRYRYPFINCTNCGPRYTIIDGVPYDRPRTSMRSFPMCPDCEAEYHDPASRRFHAQPNACPVCGPRVILLDEHGRQITTLDPIRSAMEALAHGLVVAVKGLGGFHLAVDATSDQAVRRLRARKLREEKPLAVMAPDLAAAMTLGIVSEDEEKLLTTVERPIVLLAKKKTSALAESVAPDNQYLGLMLPYTPLHHLLLEGFLALVMTSGNLSEEPIVKDNDEAIRRLEGIADLFLVHDRDIFQRADDSVVRVGPAGPRQIRRSRGFVPWPIYLAREIPELLAVGGELKNTVCLTKDNRAFLSQHIGDLTNLETLDFFNQAIDHLKMVLDIRPDAIAFDLHPDYLSTKWASTQSDLPGLGVQHHHAHIASAMAEHHLDGPVIGLAADGTGFGLDGQIWGGEILLVEFADFQRLGHLAPVVLPGGEAAIREPWRMAVSYLIKAFGAETLNLDLPLYRRHDPEKLKLVSQIVERKINSPLTTSLGRLFDAAAALIGLRDRVAFEGQAAMGLEMCCPSGDFEPYPLDLAEAGGQLLIRPEGIIRGLVADIMAGQAIPEMSGRFHASIIKVLGAAASRAATLTGIRTIVLSGGCFQNQVLTNGLFQLLEKQGLSVYTQDQVPVNDGGISLGQAVIAGWRLSK